MLHDVWKARSVWASSAVTAARSRSAEVLAAALPILPTLTLALASASMLALASASTLALALVSAST